MSRTAAIVLLAAAAVAAGEVLLRDDFEGNGFSEAWALVTEGVEIVPEDPAKPNGNHVARLDAFREALYSPPAAPGDVKTAQANEAAYDRWANYEYSFRFRLHAIEDRVKVGGNTAAFMTVCWRVWPNPENASERQLLFLQCWRPQLTWRIAGPMTAWFGRNTGFAHQNVVALNKEVLGGKANTEWHTVRICCLNDRVQLWWDGKLYFDGRDDRVLAGGVGIAYHWSGDRVKPAPIDVDDVVVRVIEALPEPEKEAE